MVFKAAPVPRSVSKSLRLIQGGSRQLSFPLLLEYVGEKMEGFRIVTSERTFEGRRRIIRRKRPSAVRLGPAGLFSFRMMGDTSRRAKLLEARCAKVVQSRGQVQ